jgi:hypothetical protein
MDKITRRSVAQQLDDTDIAAPAGYFGSLEFSTHGGQP